MQDKKKTTEITKTFYKKLRKLISVFPDYSKQMTELIILYIVMNPNNTIILILI